MRACELLGFPDGRHQQLFTDAVQHVSAVFQCMVIATAVGVLIGVLTYRMSWARNLAVLSTASLLTLPSPAAIGLLIPLVGLGVEPTVITLTLCGLLPIVRNFFPIYDAAPALHTPTYKKYPVISRLLAPLSKRLTTALARELNGQVDVVGRDPHDVAKGWLVKEGFIKDGQAPAGARTGVPRTRWSIVCSLWAHVIAERSNPV